MKKILGVALFVVMVFAFSACAEVIEFPSAKCSVDVPDGWEYSDDGEGTGTIVAPDKSASMTVSTFDPEGASLEEIAKALMQQHNGTGLAFVQEIGAWEYEFNGGKSNVIVGQDNATKEINVVAMTAANDAAKQILMQMFMSIK